MPPVPAASLASILHRPPTSAPPGYSTIAVDFKCNNAWYNCPLKYNVDFVCIATSTGPCAGVSCGAYGYCSNGWCVCSNGYSGPSCSVPPNPCANVNCGSHGSCVSGTCSCTGGYSGGGVQHRTAGRTSVTHTRIGESEPRKQAPADCSRLSQHSMRSPLLIHRCYRGWLQLQMLLGTHFRCTLPLRT